MQAVEILKTTIAGQDGLLIFILLTNKKAVYIQSIFPVLQTSITAHFPLLITSLFNFRRAAYNKGIAASGAGRCQLRLQFAIRLRLRAGR